MTVKVGDMVAQGDIIAKSGTNNLNPDLGNHLHFELILNGVNIDPENSYDKKISERDDERENNDKVSCKRCRWNINKTGGDKNK